MRSLEEFGWADGSAVPVVWDGAMEESQDREAPAGWWPNESARTLHVEHLSRREAGLVSAEARRALVWWLAGDGLHPLAWARRWTMALWLHAPSLLPGQAGLLNGAAGKFERGVMEAFFPCVSGVAAERRRLDGVWSGLGGKVERAVSRESGRLEDLGTGERPLEWCGWEGPTEERELAGMEGEALAMLAMRSLVRWLGTDGGWCLGALKRYYALVFFRYADLAPGMAGPEYGAIYGQSRAAFCEDAKRYLGAAGEELLGYRLKGSGQKSAAASAVYAASAAANCPRRDLPGGRFGAGRTEGERRNGAEARIAAARLLAERREMERDAEAMRRIAERNGARRRATEGSEGVGNTQSQAPADATLNTVE